MATLNSFGPGEQVGVFEEDILSKKLEKLLVNHNLPYGLRNRNRSDGNCWYEATADQIVMHQIENLPTDHESLRAVSYTHLTLPTKRIV